MNYQRFIVFVVALLTIVALGVTVYYFMKDDEFINLQTNEIYVNVGDTFKLSYQHDNPLDSTEIEWVIKNTDLISYDKETNIFTAVAAGETEIWLDTNRSGWAVQQCIVKIGDGTSENPFIIKSAEQLVDGLENIAEGATADSSYILVADIDLANTNFEPLFNGNSFGGEFNGNGHSISNLTITANSPIEYAGLFARISSKGYVHDLVLNNVVISGLVNNAGAVAGVNNGLIEKIQVNGVAISSQVTSYVANIGSIAGQTNAINDANASNVNYNLIGRIDRCEVFNANLQGLQRSKVGGLTAVLNGGVIINSSFNGEISSSNSSTIGAGIVAEMYATTNSNAKLKDNYAVVKFQGTFNKAGIVYTNDFAQYDKSENVIWGQYFDEEVCADSSVKAIANNGYDDTALYDKRVADKILVAEGATTQEIKVGLKEGYKYTLNPDDTFDAGQYTGMLSHVKYANSSAIEAFNYDFSIVWTQSNEVNNGYPTLQMAGKADDYFVPVSGEGTEPETPVDPEDPDNPENPEDNRTIYELLSQCAEGETVALSKDYDFGGQDWVTISSFNGILDGRGFTIKNVVVTGGASEAGLFGTLGKSAVIKNITFENVTVKSGKYVGIIAGINNGIIESVTIKNTNNTYKGIAVETNNSLYAGGIVGLNNGSINSVNSSVDITVSTSSSYEFRVGGAVGQNSGYINDVAVEANILSNATNNRVGGVAGYNESSIKYSAFSGAITTSILNNNYAGGIAGYNISSASIELSSVQGTINGYNVGGLAGYNSNSAKITKNNVYNATLKGERVGGLVSTMQNGKVDNCSVVATLVGLSDSSIKGGFATYVMGSTNVSGSGDCARIEQCFASTKFEGAGENYAETQSPIRISLANSNGLKQAGFILKSIYDKDVAGDAKTQGSSKASGGIFGGLFNDPNKGYSDGKNYNNLDGRTSTNDCKNSLTPFTTDHRSFDFTNIWSIGNGDYPKVNGVKTI